MSAERLLGLETTFMSSDPFNTDGNSKMEFTQTLNPNPKFQNPNRVLKGHDKGRASLFFHLDGDVVEYEKRYQEASLHIHDHVFVGTCPMSL